MGGVPAYMTGKAVHEWFSISSTSHAGSAADPTDDVLDPFCRSTKRLSYSNICIAGTELVLAATGGHNDYSGNEVTGIELNVDAPAWALRKSRTASVTADAAYNTSDGTPTSRHAYHSHIYSSTQSRVMLHRTRFVSTDASSYNDSNGFNLSNNTWDADGTWADGHTAGCKDSSDNVWALEASGGQQLWKWTAATDSWAQTFTSGSAGPGYPMAHDSSRSQLFALSWGNGEGGSGVAAAIFTSGGTARTTISFNASSAYTQWQADAPAYASMIYDPDGDRFLFWDGVTGRLYQITPNGTSTWDMSIVTTTGTTPPATEYAFGRLGYVPALKMIVTMPSGRTNLRAMRIA